jgi:hypothetical protein
MPAISLTNPEGDVDHHGWWSIVKGYQRHEGRTPTLNTDWLPEGEIDLSLGTTLVCGTPVCDGDDKWRREVTVYTVQEEGLVEAGGPYDIWRDSAELTGVIIASLEGETP